MACKFVELDDTNTCKICDNALAKYSCPKCEIIYCSLDCYQSNSHLECSETFYKDNIAEQLGCEKDSSEMKSKMMKILKRNHEANRRASLSDVSDSDNSLKLRGISFEDFLDIHFGNDESEKLDSNDDELLDIGAQLEGVDSDDELLDIGARLEGVDLNDAEKVWEQLTSDERQDFFTFLNSEDVAKMIPPWQPWWWYYDDRKIEELDTVEEYKKDCPEICDIMAFNMLTSKEPAENVKFNLINVLASYVFMARYFNGEYHDFPQEAVSCLTALSQVLKKGEVFDSFEMAVDSVQMQCCLIEWITTDEENIQTMREDIERILRGPKQSNRKFYILCVLSDIHKLMNDALNCETEDACIKNEFSKQFPNQHFPSVDKEPNEKIHLYMKKIDYFLSYTNEYF